MTRAPKINELVSLVIWSFPKNGGTEVGKMDGPNLEGESNELDGEKDDCSSDRTTTRGMISTRWCPPAIT